MLDQPTPHHHAVQFYGNDDSLLRNVGGFLAAGLRELQPALVIATPAHRAGILADLARRGIDLTEAKRIGDLVLLDAEEILGTFMREHAPDAAAFRHTIGAVIEQTLNGRVCTPLRAYGEMVDLLWKKGRSEAAIKVEVLWNDLAQTHDFELLCGYAIGNFYKETGLFERVCEQHTHVLADDGILTFVPGPAAN